MDVKYSKCPDYFDIIKHPMDLGTIQRKFPGKGKQTLRPSDPNTYSTPHEFRDDMRLVWSNCRTYNPPHVPVRNMGEAMSDAWEKRWTVSGIEGKWEEEMQRQGLEEQVGSCFEDRNEAKIVSGQRFARLTAQPWASYMIDPEFLKGLQLCTAVSHQGLNRFPLTWCTPHIVQEKSRPEMKWCCKSLNC